MSVSAVQTKSPRFIDPNAPLAKQQEIFKLLLKDPPENSRIVTITPPFATWVLETYNKSGNRKHKPARIRRYAEAMEHSDWLLTGEPLIFGRNKLLDGQNRLMGCVHSNKSFRTYVVFGIDDDVFTAINSGVSRSPTDTFLIAGVENHGVVSRAVRWLMIYAGGDPQARLSYSNQEMWEYYKDKVDHAAMKLAVSRTKKANKAIPPGPLAAHFYMFEKKHPATAKKLSVDFDKNQHGARKLTTMLQRARKENLGRLNDTWINALLVHTWNAYRDGRQVTSADLKHNDAREYPKIA